MFHRYDLDVVLMHGVRILTVSVLPIELVDVTGKLGSEPNWSRLVVCCDSNFAGWTVTIVP